jgi:hypothetical protein
MKQYGELCAIVLLLFLIAPLRAQDSTPGKALSDSLLDKLIGDWRVERKFGNGRAAKNVVHAEWVLQHQFVELHYRDVAVPPQYEAIILIGYDEIAKHYICHWADKFGGNYSTDGFASRDETSNAMEFKFEFHDGPATNRFAFDPQSKTWTSTIRQQEKGEWKLFCQDKFARSAQGDVVK